MLVSAPAGFGKTTLLTEWLADRPPADGPSGRVALARPGRQRPGVVLDVRHRRAADGGARRSAQDALALLQASEPPPIEAVAHDAAQRPQRPRERRRAGARRLPRHRGAARSTTAMAFLLEHLPAAAAPGDRQPRRPAVCRWPGCARAASSSRSARPICASRPTRPRRTSTSTMGLRADGAGCRRAGGSAPKAGSPRSSWRRCRCRDETTSPASSPASPATTATSSTTWSRRSCSASPSDVRQLPAADLDPRAG